MMAIIEPCTNLPIRRSTELFPSPVKAKKKLSAISYQPVRCLAPSVVGEGCADEFVDRQA